MIRTKPLNTSFTLSILNPDASEHYHYTKDGLGLLCYLFVSYCYILNLILSKSLNVQIFDDCRLCMEFWRVPCRRRGGVRFTLKGHSNFNMVMFSNVGGSGDIKNVWIRGSRTRTWVPMHRNWGANWQSSLDLQNQALSFRLRLVDGKIINFLNVVPSRWRFGQTFASKNQFY